MGVASGGAGHFCGRAVQEGAGSLVGMGPLGSDKASGSELAGRPPESES